MRPALIAAIALAVLLPRIAGLHFHVEEPHPEVHAHPVHLAGIPAEGTLGGLEHDHLLEHQAGAVDVDSVATSTTAVKSLPLLLLVAIITFTGLLQPGLRVFLPIQRPLRPPRPRRRIEILPPSQGPPHTV